jgi:PAS domain S-box-containing protein
MKDKNKTKVLTIAFIFGLLFWILDAVMDYFIYYESTFLELLITNVPPHEVYVRSMVIIFFLVFGAIISRSIAERIQVNNTLKESQRYFRTLLNQLHEDVIVIDREYKITDVNNTFLTTTGHYREDIIGKHCYEISHGYNQPCDQMGEDCKLKEVFKTGKIISCLHEHQQIDGPTVWVDLLLSPLSNPEGEITQVIESARDVTERMKTQNALQKSEGKFRSTLKSMDDLVFVLDLFALKGHWTNIVKY